MYVSAPEELLVGQDVGAENSDIDCQKQSHTV